MDQDLLQQINQMGLNPTDVLTHQKRIENALSGEQQQTTFPLIDTCRRDNAGILDSKRVNHLFSRQGFTATGGFVGFVPSAGAASRYFQPLEPLTTAWKGRDIQQRRAAADRLREQGALQWCLPKAVRQLILEPQTITTSTPNPFEAGSAKALMPCTKDGASFLALKHAEHRSLPEIVGEAYVASPGSAEVLKQKLIKLNHHWNSSLPGEVLVQGPQQSTLRFDQHGQPLLMQGQPSVVPAGHGTLAGLFPAAARSLPAHHSLLIRNIDNVHGTSDSVRLAVREFLLCHDNLRQSLNQLRSAAQSGLCQRVHNLCALLLKCPDPEELPRDRATEEFLHGCSSSERPLWEVLAYLFHTPLELMQQLQQRADGLSTLLQRPLNTMGQVANKGSDVGGTPVFAQVGEQKIKLCIEQPHVSSMHAAALRDATKATHFNPVFVAAEQPDSDFSYQSEHLWILAKKTFGGQPAYYHESVLYELLGNSQLANCCFVEIPRSLFNPHKSLADIGPKSTADWCPDLGGANLSDCDSLEST